MNTVIIIAAIVGSLIIAVTVWQIVKRGIPDTSGRFSDHWHWPSGG